MSSTLRAQVTHASVEKLVSALRVPHPHKARRMRNPEGPKGRLDKLRKTVTALVQYERIELNYHRADEARLYAERLISEAIRHGDRHTQTMEAASFWLFNKQLVHKLFKVLVPRFENSDLSYTRLFKAPLSREEPRKPRAVLELRGNPFPQIKPNTANRMLIHNVLLDAAKHEHRQQKYAEALKNVSITPESIQEVVPDQVS